MKPQPEKISYFTPKPLGETEEHKRRIEELKEFLQDAARSSSLKYPPKDLGLTIESIEAPELIRIGPARLTVQEWKERQSLRKEKALTKIPENPNQPRLFPLKKKTNRGGRKVREKRLANALATLRHYKISLCDNCNSKICSK